MNSYTFFSNYFLISLEVETGTKQQENLEELDQKTQQKMQLFFSTKLPELLEEQPQLDERETHFIFSETDTWPTKKWEDINWTETISEKLDQVEKRIKKAQHYEALVGVFEELFSEKENIIPVERDLEFENI